MLQGHRKLFYDTKWWMRYVVHIRNLFAPYHVICTGVSNYRIQGDLLFEDPLYLSAQGAAQFRQCKISGVAAKHTVKPTLSVAVSAEGSSRP